MAAASEVKERPVVGFTQEQLDAAVRAMRDVGFSTGTESKAWEIQRVSLHVIASCCFGHDGARGHGKPKEAAMRRAAAAKAGAIEAIVDVMRASVARAPPNPSFIRHQSRFVVLPWGNACARTAHLRGRSCASGAAGEHYAEP